MEHQPIKMVYRIEHPSDGCGIFVDCTEDLFTERSCKVVGWDFLNEVYERHSLMCGMRQDMYAPELTDPYSNYYCSYQSLETLKRFISKTDLNALIDAGYILYQLWLSEYNIGIDQIIFKKTAIVKKRNVNYLVKYFNNEDAL